MAVTDRELEARMLRMERTNRLLGLALAVTIGTLFFLGAGKAPSEVTTTSLRLVDAEGAIRAELSMKDENPVLSLKDEKGGDRLTLMHEKDGTGLFILDAEGTTRIGVAQFAHGGGGVALHGPGSKGAAVLYLKGEGSLRFYDGEGKITNQVKGAPPAE